MSASEEVDNATGFAPAKENVIELLKEKRTAQLADRERYAVAKQMRDEDEMAAVRHRIDARKEVILALEIDAAVVIEATGQREAQARLLAIRRAHGSTVASYQDDEAKVEQAVAALKEAITTLNSRARKLEALSAESAALCDRFGITAPLLTMVSEPQDVASSLPAPWRLHPRRPSFEFCEHNLRQRRDYAEIGGSVGYAVIQTAGLKPFRALTEREREVLEDRENERKPDPVLAQAGVEALALSNLGVPGGGVHRG